MPTDKVVQIHKSKQPRRPHYVPEWARLRNLNQVGIATEISVDKSLVSRWFKGSTPSEKYQARLAALFQCEPEALFRHPNDDWLTRFFQGRSKEEIERAKALLEAGFPRKRA